MPVDTPLSMPLVARCLHHCCKPTCLSCQATQQRCPLPTLVLPQVVRQFNPAYGMLVTPLLGPLPRLAELHLQSERGVVAVRLRGFWA